MKGNTVTDKIKAFVKKNERKIKLGAAIATLLGLGYIIMTDKDHIKKLNSNVKNVDDLDDDEWEHLIDMARQMDEYVAERRALKEQQ
jgi:hypothetical protein